MSEDDLLWALEVSMNEGGLAAMKVMEAFAHVQDHPQPPLWLYHEILLLVNEVKEGAAGHVLAHDAQPVLLNDHS